MHLDQDTHEEAGTIERVSFFKSALLIFKKKKSALFSRIGSGTGFVSFLDRRGAGLFITGFRLAACPLHLRRLLPPTRKSNPLHNLSATRVEIDELARIPSSSSSNESNLFLVGEGTVMEEEELQQQQQPEGENPSRPLPPGVRALLESSSSSSSDPFERRCAMNLARSYLPVPPPPAPAR